MKISYFPKFLPLNSKMVFPEVLDAMRTTDELVENSFDADAAVIWSVLWFGNMRGNEKVWQHYRAHDKPVFVVEVGGISRNETWKLGVNGINRDADFGLSVGYDDSRINKLDLGLKPWNPEGEYIVITGQHEHSEQWRFMPGMEEYYKTMVQEARALTDKPIVLRSHPRWRENVHWRLTDPLWFKEHGCEFNVAQKVHKTYDSFDFEDQLKHTSCVFSYSSNAGVTSVLHGVPVYTSPKSLAYDMSSPDCVNLKTPDRHDWLCRLSYIEWHANEIREQWSRIRSLF